MSKQIVHANTVMNLNLFMFKTFNRKQTYLRTRLGHSYKPIKLSVFKLFILDCASRFSISGYDIISYTLHAKHGCALYHMLAQ